MADERQQQCMIDDQSIRIKDEFPQIKNLQNSSQDEELIIDPTKDSILKMNQGANDYAQTSSNNINQNSVLNENLHPLSDHSYIHSSHTNINVQSCDMNSQDTDSSDAGVKQETCNKDLQISALSLGITNNTSDNTQILEPSTVSEDNNKICFNGNVSTFQNNNHCSNVDTYSDLETIKNSVSATNSSCVKSSIETALLGNYNPLFVINKLDSTDLSATLSLPSTSHDFSSIKLPPKQTNAPLGSVQNPIQIIQNGSSYLATQTLTEAQKQQITHVLQKQQAKKALETEGKSVIYDPCTNTRIVCRIVHPSELQSKNSEPSTSEPTLRQPQAHEANSFRGRGRPRKLQCRKNKEEEKVNPALSKEEREEKKKHRPRTRSGRISKPPSYMVKDYKRIHHLDFNEEPFDDSDGGYSDYQVSDDESENRLPKNKSLPPGKV